MEVKSREERIKEINKLLDKPRQDFIKEHGWIYGQQEMTFAHNRGIAGYIMFAQEDIEEEAIRYASSFKEYIDKCGSQWICQFSNIKMKYVEILFQYGATIDMQQLRQSYISHFENNHEFLDLLFKYHDKNIKNFRNHVSNLYTVFSDINIIKKLYQFITEQKFGICNINDTSICKTPEILEFLIEKYQARAILQSDYFKSKYGYDDMYFRVPYLDKLEFLKVIVKYPELIRECFQYDIGENEECQMLIIETMHKNKIDIPIRCISSFKIIIYLYSLEYDIKQSSKYNDLITEVISICKNIEEKIVLAVLNSDIELVKKLFYISEDTLSYLLLLRYIEEDFKETYTVYRKMGINYSHIIEIFYNKILQRLLLHSVLQHKHEFLRELLKLDLYFKFVDFKWDLDYLHEKRPIGQDGIIDSRTKQFIKGARDKKLGLLHYALLDKDYEIARILVEAGIDINVKIEDRDITFYLDGTIGRCTPKQTIDKLLYPTDDRHIEQFKKQIEDLKTENLHLRDKISSLDATNNIFLERIKELTMQLSIRPLVINP